ncbi:MAG TPA: hypothetical protein VEZ51_05780, partial [Gemmatimonadaceae bacterium]|nr:hypothetical protein [Gemmatimonadaceae bacterium]
MLGDSASEVRNGSKKVRAVVLQGRVMIFRVFHHQRPSIHVFGPRESRERPMHEEQQSVTTIYGDTQRFRNDDNN